MRKILGGIFIFLGLISFTNANCIQFTNTNLCLNVQKNGSNYQVSYTNSNSINESLVCDVKNPNNVVTNVGSCNKSFSYNGLGIGTMTWYIMVGNQYKSASFSYDYTNGNFTNNNTPIYNNNTPTYNNYTTSYFVVSPNTSSLNTNQTLYSLQISAKDTSNSTVTSNNSPIYRTIEYTNGNYRYNASNSQVSTTNGVLNLSNGSITNYNPFSFYQEGTYRIKVTQNNITSYSSSIVVNNTNNTNNNLTTNIKIDLNNSNFSINQTLSSFSIQANNSNNTVITSNNGYIYRTVEYLDGNNRYNASTNKITTINGTAQFVNGTVTLNNPFSFLETGNYRIRATHNNITAYSYNININNTYNNGGTSYFTITPGNTSLNTNQTLYSLQISAKDTSNSTVTSNNSPIYRTIEYTNGNYRYNASNSQVSTTNGVLTLSNGSITNYNPFSFYQEGTYRIKVTQNNITSYSSSINIGNTNNIINNNPTYNQNGIYASIQNPIVVTNQIISANIRSSDTYGNYNGSVNWSITPINGSYGNSQNIITTYGTNNTTNINISDKNSGTRRIIVRDSNNSNYTDSAIFFKVQDFAGTYFSTKAKRTVKDIYRSRDAFKPLFYQKYPTLINNKERSKTFDSMKSELGKVYNKNSDAQIKNYNEYVNLLQNFGSYTQSVR